MTYPGGKGAEGVAQTIINQQPPHDVYIEPFLGGGSILAAKREAELNIGIDLDPAAIGKFADGGSRWQFSCENGIQWLGALRFDEKRFAGKRVLIYCDPPYMMETRRNYAKMYRFEMTDLQHSAFLSFIVHSPHMVQVSGYDSLMYRTWLEDWRCVKFRAATRHGVRTECLWMNYAEPEQLHDYSFLGRNFRERQNIRRKARRWVSRLHSLPRLQRLAIYGEMASSIGISDDAAGPNSPDRTFAGGNGVFSEAAGSRSAIGNSPNLPTRDLIDRASAGIAVLE